MPGDLAKHVAVAVGISYTEYYLNNAHLGMSAYTATSGTLSVVCGRLSFTLGLKGPSVSIDTACSSSLVCSRPTGVSTIFMCQVLFRLHEQWLVGGLCTSGEVRGVRGMILPAVLMNIGGIGACDLQLIH